MKIGIWFDFMELGSKGGLKEQDWTTSETTMYQSIWAGNKNNSFSIELLSTNNEMMYHKHTKNRIQV
jgi:hypothetical protein